MCCDIDAARVAVVVTAIRKAGGMAVAMPGYVNGAILNVTGGAHAGRAHLPPSRRAEREE